MKQYLDLLGHILENGDTKEDRTGTGTISVFGTMMKFDLSKGFPLMTTKKMFIKGVVTELLWMISGSTNVKPLQDAGNHIWDSWRQMYSLKREIDYVARKAPTLPATYAGDFSIAGLGFDSASVDGKLVSAWVHMMGRCYDPTHHRYALYGGAGATVHPRWHDPSVFVREAQCLPHWVYKLSDWNRFELDKDYFGAMQYGPETSVWLSTEENNLYTKAANNVEITDAEGHTSAFLTQSIAAAQIGMSTSTLSRFLKEGVPTILKGNNKQYLGWEFKVKPPDPDLLMRLALVPDGELGPVYGHAWRHWGPENFDQLAEVIEQIKKNPNSRRLIVTAWNPDEVPHCGLPPCHILFQFSVTDGELHCALTQRSGDMFLGVPFNIASYALLTHLVADVCGLKAGILTHYVNDAHIYKNHVDQVKTQLAREPMKLCQLRLTHRDSIDQFKYEDIEIVDYVSHPAIKAPVAV